MGIENERIKGLTASKPRARRQLHYVQSTTNEIFKDPVLYVTNTTPSIHGAYTKEEAVGQWTFMDVHSVKPVLLGLFLDLKVHKRKRNLVLQNTPLLTQQSRYL